MICLLIKTVSLTLINRSWRHWGCTTPKVINNLKASFEDPTELDGYEDLNAEDQAKIRTAYEEGHVADEDIPDTARKEGDDGEEEEKPKKKRATKKSKATVDEDEEEGQEEEEEKPKKKRAPAKKAKAVDEDMEEDDEEEKPKPARKPRAKVCFGLCSSCCFIILTR